MVAPPAPPRRLAARRRPNDDAAVHERLYTEAQLRVARAEAAAEQQRAEERASMAPLLALEQSNTLLALRRLSGGDVEARHDACERLYASGVRQLHARDEAAAEAVRRHQSDGSS